MPVLMGKEVKMMAKKVVKVTLRTTVELNRNAGSCMMEVRPRKRRAV